MNKKLIAVAIAAAVAAPAAMAADTTLYGKVHMSIAAQNDRVEVNDHSNRIGVKGSEDLGNGLKAVFKYEMGYNGADEVGQTVTDSAGNTHGDSREFSPRNSYIGLAGDFGTFLVGRHDTPAKVAFYAAGNERLGDSLIDLNGGFGFDELRITDAIAYISPSFSGVTVAAAIVPGEQRMAGSADGIADAYSIGVIYGGHGLKAGLGYTNGEDYTGLNDAELLNIGATYSMDMFSVGAQYQNTNAGGNERDVWALTGTVNFGNNQVIAMYGNADDDAAGERDTFGLALKHKFSKRTSAYVAYRGDDGDPALGSNWIGNGGTTQVDDAFGIGMIHNF